MKTSIISGLACSALRACRLPRRVGRGAGAGQRRRRPPARARCASAATTSPATRPRFPSVYSVPEARRPARRLHRERAAGLQVGRAHASFDARDRGEPERPGHGRSRGVLCEPSPPVGVALGKRNRRMKKLAFAAVVAALVAAAPRTPAIPKPARRKSRTCAACHGPDGNSAAARFPEARRPALRLPRENAAATTSRARARTRSWRRRSRT